MVNVKVNVMEEVWTIQSEMAVQTSNEFVLDPAMI